MRNPNPVTRFYQIKPGESGWARIWITDDACFTCVSDWRNWGYWWGNPGQEFRRFLISCDESYLTTCLMQGDRKTERQVRAFLKHVWPLFVEQLKAELALEAA